MADRPGVFERIRESLRGRRRTRDEPAGTAGAGVASRPSAPAPSPFEIDLRALLGEREVLAAGRLQVIGLGRIAAEMGERWERLAGRTHAIVADHIEQSLRPGDVFTRMGDLHYLVLFAGLTRGEAQVKAGVIARAIADRLLGQERGHAGVDVRSVMLDLDEGVRLESVDILDAIAGNIGDDAGERADAGGDAGVDPARPPPIRDPWRDDFKVVMPTLPADLTFRFRPLWDVRNDALSTYLCVAANRRPDPDLGDDAAAIYLGDNADLIARIDALASDRIGRELRVLFEQERRLVLGLQVHYLTLTRASVRADWLRRLDAIPAGLRDHLIFELAGLPDAVPAGRAVELVGLLKARGRSVVARLPLGRKVPPVLAGSGLHAVGVDVGRSAGRERRAMAQFDQFAEQAGALRLRTYVQGLASLSLTTAAIASGFDYIHSDAIEPAGDTPSYAYRFRFMDLYAKLLTEPR